VTDHPCAADGCNYPAQDGTICFHCVGDLERDLGEVAAYRAELETSLARQSAIGEREGGRSAEKPLPIDMRASEALSVLRSTLVAWSRLVVEEDDAPWPDDTLDAMASLLMSRVGWLRVHPAGHEAVDELRAAMSLARRVVDRPADRWFAGPCSECKEPLYARPNAAQVSCRACELVYDVAERREWLREATESYLATAREISGLCQVMFGELVTASMIRGYAHRGTIAPHGVKRDDRGRDVPLYRMGDVFAAAARAAADPQSRRAARKDARDAVA
jgi:hypothetical protein